MSALGHSRRKRLGPLVTHVRCTSKSGHKCVGSRLTRTLVVLSIRKGARPMQVHEASSPPAAICTPWNKGKLIGAKPPLWPKHVAGSDVLTKPRPICQSSQWPKRWHHVEQDVRVPHVELMQCRRNKAFDCGLEAIYVDRSGLEVLQRCNMGLYARELAHHSFDPRQQHLACRCQHHPLRAAVEDRRS